MKCPSCSADNLTGLYCSNCGSKLANEEPDIQENDSLNIKPIDQKPEDLTNHIVVEKDTKTHKERFKFKKMIFVSIGILALFLIIVTIQNHNKNEAAASEVDYQKGIELEKNEKWAEAAKIFNTLQTKGYRDSNIHYAEIQKTLSYQNGIQFIKDKKWAEADKQLESLQKENYKDSRVLYAYVTAQQQYLADFMGAGIIENNIAHLEPVQKNLNEISTDYSGLFAQDIKDFKTDIDKQLQSLRNNLAESNKEMENRRSEPQGVRIGMTQLEVLNSSWGKPNHINKTTGSYGVHEQWVYGGNNYLYFENGILTTIQN